MKTILWVRKEFEAAHSLEGTFPAGHQCARMHGHRYMVTLEVSTYSLNDVVVDYYELQAGLSELLSKYEHRNLNDVMSCPTTCENLARELMARCKQRWPQTSCVEVQEQSNTGCMIVDDDRM